MEEIWKPLITIPQVVGQFEISNKGKIRRVGAFNTQQSRNIHTYKKTRVNKTGYVYAQFWYNGANHPERLHRLVALHFIPNPNNYAEVNHLDGDRTNNCQDNLEWSDRSANTIHSFRVLGRSPHRWSVEERAKIAERSRAVYQKMLAEGFDFSNKKHKKEGVVG